MNRLFPDVVLKDAREVPIAVCDQVGVIARASKHLDGRAHEMRIARVEPEWRIEQFGHRRQQPVAGEAQPVREPDIRDQEADELAGKEALPDTDGADLLSLFTQVSDEEESDSVESSEDAIDSFLQKQKSNFGFEQLYVTTASGAILASTDPALSSGNFAAPDGALLLRGKQEVYFGTVIREGSRFVTYAAAPVASSQNGDVLIAKIDLSRP